MLLPGAPRVVVECQGGKYLGGHVSEHVQEAVDGGEEELLVFGDPECIDRLHRPYKRDREQPPRDLGASPKINAVDKVVDHHHGVNQLVQQSVGHPRAVQVDAPELDRDLAEEGFGPTSLLGHPGNEADWCVGVADGVLGEFDLEPFAKNQIGQVAVVTVGAEYTEEGLFDPGVHHVSHNRHTVDAQWTRDTVDNTVVRLRTSFQVEGEPVPDGRQETDPSACVVDTDISCRGANNR